MGVGSKKRQNWDDIEFKERDFIKFFNPEGTSYSCKICCSPRSKMSDKAYEEKITSNPSFNRTRDSDGNLIIDAEGKFSVRGWHHHVERSKTHKAAKLASDTKSHKPISNYFSSVSKPRNTGDKAAASEPHLFDYAKEIERKRCGGVVSFTPNSRENRYYFA
jgi:hypothetical protein